MPDGVSARNAGSSKALAGLTIDARHGSAGLVRTAIAAVERIAAARGRPIAAPVTNSSGGGGGVPAPLLGAAAIALVMAAGAAAFRARAGTRRSGVAGSGS
jgi:hypothetical protein